MFPAWARRAARSGTPRLTDKELATLIDLAREWPILVSTGKSSKVFARLAAAAQAAWKHEGRTTDAARRVVKELDLLVPAFAREQFTAQSEQLRWFVEKRAKLRHSKGAQKRIDRLLKRRPGAPPSRAKVAALFSALRNLGYSYAHALDAAADASGLKPKAVESAADRNSLGDRDERTKWLSPEEESAVKPCLCDQEYPYCKSCKSWFSPKDEYRRIHVCDQPLEPRRVSQTILICRLHEKSRLLPKRVGAVIRLRCPACKRDEAEIGKAVERLLPHHHCATCNRPSPVKGAPPILRPVGMNAWACNDNPNDTAGCLALARRTLLVSEKAQRGRRKKGAQTPP
jgi:transposase-like protein